MPIVTQSSLQMYRDCPRKYKYRYIDELVKIGRVSRAMDFGTAIHAGLDAYHSAQAGPHPSEALHVAVSTVADAAQGQDTDLAVAMITGYDLAYAAEPLPAVATELLVGRYLREPAVVPGYRLCGKIDGLIRHQDETWLIEHKTTSALSGGYIDRLQIDAQTHMYITMLLDAGTDVAGTIYNVLVKPRLQRRVAETPDEWSRRLAKTLADGRHYQRVWLPVIDWAIEETCADADATLGAIHRSAETGVYWRNVGACTRWGSVCDYLDLCTSRSFGSNCPVGYTTKPPHSELGDVQ